LGLAVVQLGLVPDLI